MRVALFVTCLVDGLFPDVGKATVGLLERLGCAVEVPLAQTCCGQPMVNTGYLDEAVPVVRTYLSAFSGYDAVVTPSGSCAGSARHQHGLVARRFRASAMGAELDNLADVISFGFAPAFMIVIWGGFNDDLPFEAVVGAAAALLVAGVVRLARRGDRWPIGRTVSWLAGIALLWWCTNGALNLYQEFQF